MNRKARVPADKSIACPPADAPCYTVAQAAAFLKVTPAKIRRMMDEGELIWEQFIGDRQRLVEGNSLRRHMQPDKEPEFPGLGPCDRRELQLEIDAARHRIAKAANLPPAAVKIHFHLY